MAAFLNRFISQVKQKLSAQKLLDQARFFLKSLIKVDIHSAPSPILSQPPFVFKMGTSRWGRDTLSLKMGT